MVTHKSHKLEYGGSNPSPAIVKNNSCLNKQKGRKIMAFIYVITNDINGKQYVGKTNDTIENRYEQHLSDRKRRKCEKRPLYSAMNKYGVEHFSIEELEECSPEDAPGREAYWIDRLNNYHYGYNATRGGEGKPIYDYKQIADKYLELKNQKETALFFGCSADTVKIACLECKINTFQNGKPVAKIDKDTGEILQIYPSLSAASIDNCGTTKNRSLIARVCQNQRPSAFGSKWSFI